MRKVTYYANANQAILDPATYYTNADQAILDPPAYMSAVTDNRRLFNKSDKPRVMSFIIFESFAMRGRGEATRLPTAAAQQRQQPGRGARTPQPQARTEKVSPAAEPMTAGSSSSSCSLAPVVMKMPIEEEDFTEAKARGVPRWRGV